MAPVRDPLIGKPLVSLKREKKIPELIVSEINERWQYRSHDN